MDYKLLNNKKLQMILCQIRFSQVLVLQTKRSKIFIDMAKISILCKKNATLEIFFI